MQARRCRKAARHRRGGNAPYDRAGRAYPYRAPGTRADDLASRRRAPVLDPGGAAPHHPGGVPLAGLSPVRVQRRRTGLRSAVGWGCLRPSWRFWIKSTCPKEFFWPPQPLDLVSERLNYNPWRSRSACSARKFRVPLRPLDFDSRFVQNRTHVHTRH